MEAVNQKRKVAQYYYQRKTAPSCGYDEKAKKDDDQERN